MNTNSKVKTIKIWDIWTRVSHWLMAFLFVLAIISSKVENYDVHIIVSSALVGIVMFRIIWGFIGSENIKWRRFFSEITGWSSQLKTLFSKKSGHHTGHTALGALMALVIFSFIIFQGITALFFKDFDAYDYVGILGNTLPSFRDLAKNIHEIIGNTLIFLTIFHVVAALYYLIWKKINLIWVLIIGSRKSINNEEKSLEFGSPSIALISILIVAILIIMIYHIF